MADMNKYNSPNDYIMYELKEAHEKLLKYQNDMFEAAKKIRALEAHIVNQNLYIEELKSRLGIK